VNASTLHALMDSTIARPLGPEDPGEIGRFKLIGLLGRGGMGEVYLGSTEGGYVAVKQILPSASSVRSPSFTGFR
jgi:serine/threonine protein kinase